MTTTLTPEQRERVLTALIESFLDSAESLRFCSSRIAERRLEHDMPLPMVVLIEKVASGLALRLAKAISNGSLDPWTLEAADQPSSTTTEDPS